LKRRRCKGTASKGVACRAAALVGSEYCFWHDPHARAARSAASRHGGVSRAAGFLAEDEATLAERLADPATWGEHYLRNRDGSPRRYWPHQVEDLRAPDPQIVHLDGRDCGKTISLTTDVLHFAFTTRGGLGLVAAPQQGHLDTIIEEIEFQLRAHEQLAASVAPNAQGRQKPTRDPYFRLEFTNGSVLYFRPAGPDGEAFRSLHVNRIWVDEGAWLPEKAWHALRQCLKAGGVFRVYSTPNGLRGTTYHNLTEARDWRVFRWPSWLNPAWSAQREADLLGFYGGKGSDGWQHEVAGEHGKPTHGAFNAELLELCRVAIPEYRCVEVLGETLTACETEEEAFDRLEMLLNLAPQDGTFWVGGDLGYTNDPTELVVLRETPGEEKRPARLVLRVHMEHVAYPHIAVAIGILERYYCPMGIGVDNGGNGMAVVQELTTLDKFRSLELGPKLHGYDFGGMVTVAERDGRLLKKRTKEHMTSLINRAFQRRELFLPDSDREIADQFSTHSYSFASNNNVVYSKGNDHIVDAVRCAMLARERERSDDFEVIVPNVVPVWTDPIFW